MLLLLDIIEMKSKQYLNKKRCEVSAVNIVCRQTAADKGAI